MGDKISAQTNRGWRDRLTVAFVSVFFVGFAPVASGTVGSLPAVGVAFFLSQRPIIILFLAVVLFLAGTALSSRAETILGRKDPSEIVIDEFVGMLVAFLWIPMSWTSIILVFLLFRVFDILKPFPAGRCERIEGGFGVMADDVVAGIYANIVFRIILFFF
jgi:phosphatidylglycerophosphatase A